MTTYAFYQTPFGLLKTGIANETLIRLSLVSQQDEKNHPTCLSDEAYAQLQVLILIPCHRVIGSNGSLTGYAWGLEMKQALLKLEQGCAE